MIRLRATIQDTSSIQAPQPFEDQPVEIAMWPEVARVDALISAVRITPQYNHARLRIWNRGGGSGELTVNAVDATKITARLLASTTEEIDALLAGARLKGTAEVAA